MSDLRTFKTLLITGANRGIGLEFVKQYAAEAEKIYACCRNPENAHALAQLSQESNNIEIIPLDVKNHQQIEALQQRLSGQKIDLLINNAGIFHGRSGELDKDKWLETLEVNALSPIYITLALKDNLSLNESIVANITSKMGSIADNTSGGSIIYRSSKAALNAAIKSLAIDLSELEINTLLLHPGWVRTDMGGPNGMIDTITSVRGMRKLLASSNNKMNGLFFNYDGTPIPW